MRVEDLISRYERPRASETVVFGGKKVEFVIEAVSGDRYDEVRAQFPPTEDDWKRFEKVSKATTALTAIGRMQVRVPDVHLPKAIPVLLGEGVVSVDGEEVTWNAEDGQKLWAALSDGDRDRLQIVVFNVNNQADDVPLSDPATEQTRDSGSGSTIAASEESPTPDLPEESAVPNGRASTEMSSLSG